MPGERQEYILTAYHRTHTHSFSDTLKPRSKLDPPINRMAMFFNWGRRQEKESMQTLGEHGAPNQNTTESPLETLKPVKDHIFPVLCLACKVGDLNSLLSSKMP